MTSAVQSSSPTLRDRTSDLLARSGLLIALLLLFLALALFAPNFLTSRNLLNVLRAVAFNGIIACGMTFMIIAGDIDVSVGSAVAWASALLGVLAIQHGWPLGLAVIFVLVQGALIHAGAGYIRVRWAVPAFVVTLALFMALRGAARLITNAFPITPFPDSFNFWGGGYIFGIIPVPVVIMLAVFVLFHFISVRTVYGRSVYAVGGNEESARLSGISVWRTRITTFALLGFLSAFSGIILSSRIMSGSSNIAVGLEFDVIAAVIIGGTSLAGGEGTIFGTFLGVLFIGLLSNGMVLMGINPFAQEVIRGLIILVAVLISVARTRK
ncbi:MAG: ABC transporter permease [Anaerolineae bacterium]|nr:ABC transporter permease [Anaerolineae bacterium]MCB9131596.1 ABC transporter permease [Anaerolineales bacterium]MCB0231501.1 ABC transporter permease [Anaerolineae bacterium]MCB0244957.1 ABC transporter permease [Anaerolineae bacterium]MCB0249408.1 ABC transporter permease [Anaerolineae bacterium]